MKIQDVTNELTYRAHPTKCNVRFNPSIVHHKKNIFYMVYRLFVPKGNPRNNGIPIPWKTKWKSETQHTVFTVLKLINGKFKVISETPVVSPDDYQIEDARIFKRTGRCYLSFNTWSWNMKGWTRKTANSNTFNRCNSSYSCTYMAKSLLSIKANEVRLKNITFPCLNSSRMLPALKRCYDDQCEEKNWLWFHNKDNDRLMVYWFEPHTIFKENKNKCYIHSETHPKNSTYGEKALKKVWPTLAFRLSAAPISYNKTEYLAMGHIKYQYLKDTIIPKHILKKKILHFDISCPHKRATKLVYMMFFYTFSKSKPHRVKRVSHAFVPEDNKYLLPFPMSIANNTCNSFIISYGEGDKLCKMLTMSRSEIESLLIKYEDVNPQNYKFIVGL